MQTLRLDGHNPDHIAEAAAILRRGGLVAIPTETVYGLAADATSAEAVLGIYRAKGRPSHNPLIVHVTDANQAARWARWNPAATLLADAFWPGPLTMVLSHPNGIAPPALAGGTTVGLRAPRHPVAQALLAACGLPLAAPSANASNALSPTTAEAVLDTLDGRIEAVLDGGPCLVGLESTVLDLAGEQPRVLRPGVIGAEAIAAVLGLNVAEGAEPTTDGPLRSPGQLSRHYAPRIPLHVVDNVASLATPSDAIIRFSDDPCPARFAVRLPRDPLAVAARLYATLRDAERSGASRILLESPPAGNAAWAPVLDRIRRAATPAE